MKASIIKLKFNTAIHYGNSGKPGLLNSDNMILSDTLYSALIDNNPKILDKLLNLVENNDLRISDLFPYVSNHLLIKKSLKPFKFSGDLEIDRTLYKKMKNTQYILLNKINEYYNDCSPKLINDTYNISSEIGTSYIQTRNRVSRNNEDTVPYIVSNFRFNKNSGLYLIVKYSSKNNLDFLINELKKLGLIGIGGRRSSGLGKFEILSIEEYNEPTNGKLLLTSTILPNKLESNIRFNVIKRSGFYNTNEGSFKKRDIYAIESGLILSNELNGQILSDLGKEHTIYRILMPLYVRVEIWK